MQAGQVMMVPEIQVLQQQQQLSVPILVEQAPQVLQIGEQNKMHEAWERTFAIISQGSEGDMTKNTIIEQLAAEGITATLNEVTLKGSNINHRSHAHSPSILASLTEALLF